MLQDPFPESRTRRGLICRKILADGARHHLTKYRLKTTCVGTRTQGVPTACLARRTRTVPCQRRLSLLRQQKGVNSMALFPDPFNTMLGLQDALQAFRTSGWLQSG